MTHKAGNKSGKKFFNLKVVQMESSQWVVEEVGTLRPCEGEEEEEH